MTDNTHGQVPEALPAIQRFEVVDCIDDKHVPAVIPKPHGPWVRYEDHIAALAGGQATAAQQGVDNAALPTHSHTGRVYEEGFLIGTCPLYTADQMRAFADATHALRVSHGQAPAQAAPQREPVEMPAEIEQMATGRYKVVPSHESMFHRWAVVAGTGAQQLYLGREVECQNMARKFAGAFLDGAFAYHSMTVAPTTQPSPAAQGDALDAARWRWLSEHIQVAWNEGKFTSLARIVSEQHRQSINASVDRMMAGDWSDADAARAAQEGKSCPKE